MADFDDPDRPLEDWEDPDEPDQEFDDDPDRLEDVQECPACGCQMHADAAICPLCGEQLLSPSTSMLAGRPWWYAALALAGVAATAYALLRIF